MDLCYFPDSFLCYKCYHSVGCDGREDEVFRILHLQCGDFTYYLSDVGALDMGRRLAGTAWLP